MPELEGAEVGAVDPRDAADHLVDDVIVGIEAQMGDDAFGGRARVVAEEAEDADPHGQRRRAAQELEDADHLEADVAGPGECAMNNPPHSNRRCMTDSPESRSSISESMPISRCFRTILLGHRLVARGWS